MLMPQPMMSLIGMGQHMFSAARNLSSLVLNKFGSNTFEGVKLMESIVYSNITALETFCLNDVKSWI